MWDKKCSKENLDTSPSLLSINFFATVNFLKHSTEGFPYEIFWHCETKKFWQKIVILLPSPPFLSIIFFETRMFVKHRRVPLRNFSVLWDNKFSIENRDISLLGIKFFDTRIFLKHRRVPRRNFSALWNENFSTENRDTLLHKVQKSVVELMFVRTFWNLISKQ